MPELPEVQTVVNELNIFFKNKTIKKITANYKLFQSNDHDIKGKKILDIKRKGKFIIFELTDDFYIVCHLRMEGKFFIKPENKHDHIFVEFKEIDEQMIFNDIRKFGTFEILNKDEFKKHKGLEKIGLDPILDSISIKDVKDKLKNSNKKIKPLLLDQSIITGIGNIYADEILLKSKINPQIISKKLNDEQIKTIIKNSIRILKKAIKLKGSSIKSYNHFSKEGGYQKYLIAYGQEKQICKQCKKNYIQKIKLSGRGTHFCFNCQPYPIIIGITGGSGSGKSYLINYINKKNKTIKLDEINKKIFQDNIIKIQKLFNTNKKKNELKKIILDKINKDEKILNEYNKLMHPLIAKKVNSIINKNNTLKYIFIEAANINNFLQLINFNKIILIKANKEIRFKRINQKEKDVNIINNYINISDKDINKLNKNKIDFIIENNYNNNDIIKKYEELNIEKGIKIENK